MLIRYYTRSNAMDLMFDFENLNLIYGGCFKSMNRRENVRLWKTRKSQVDSHIRGHCFFTELELVRESMVAKDNGRYKLLMQRRMDSPTRLAL